TPEQSITYRHQRSRTGPVVAIVGLATVVVLGVALVAIFQLSREPAPASATQPLRDTTPAAMASDGLTNDPRPEASAAASGSATAAPALSIEAPPATSRARPSPPAPKATAAAPARAPTRTPSPRTRDPIFGF